MFCCHKHIRSIFSFLRKSQVTWFSSSSSDCWEAVISGFWKLSVIHGNWIYLNDSHPEQCWDRVLWYPRWGCQIGLNPHTELRWKELTASPCPPVLGLPNFGPWKTKMNGENCCDICKPLWSIHNEHAITSLKWY